jgi:hypothetical protein
MWFQKKTSKCKYWSNQSVLYRDMSTVTLECSQTTSMTWHPVRTHPNGYRIVESVKGMEFDRFIYDMYSAQRYSALPPNSHSWKLLTCSAPPSPRYKFQVYTQDFKQTSLPYDYKQWRISQHLRGGLHLRDAPEEEGWLFRI